MKVRLGYEVGTGEPVDVPVAHMIVTGQTQLSGKTTTLEGLVHRAQGMRALAFVTKRGEGTFGGSAGRRRLLLPYFRERTDWQFVSAILEAETRERMKYERSWIMKACRGARTLRDVRKNVDKLGGKSKSGFAQDMYMMLGAYLDAVLPVLDRVEFARDVRLQDGLNIVDLENVPVQVQGLVIASMLQWVHERERNVTTILPESWKFIPQGRNSPVKMATVSLAREGAGIGNLLWLDSQDIAGAEKEIVRQASVWLIGVQREANEIKRAIGQMGHGIKKPTATQVAQLERGQFYACWGTHAVRTYVQPAWMKEDLARAYALGKLTAEFAQPPEAPRAPAFAIPSGPGRWVPDDEPEEDEMTPEQEKKLDQMIAGQTAVMQTLGLLAQDRIAALGARRPDAPADEPGAVGETREHPPVAGMIDEEALYRKFRERLLKEPGVLRVLASKPEIEVVVERQVITVDGKTLKGQLAQLVEGGFFDDPAAGNAAYEELKRRGFSTAKPNVYRELDGIAAMGFLTKETGGYQAVKDMKVNVVRK